MAETTATQSLPGGLTATYTLTGENGTLYVQVYDSTGRILAADSASYANKSEIVIQVTGQIANELKDVRSEIATVQGQINQLTAVINDPSTNPQDKAFAERSVGQARSQLAILQQEEDGLYRANLSIGSQFSTITTNLNKTAAAPGTAPASTPTVTNTGTGATTTTSTNNSSNLTGPASDDSGSVQTNTNGTTAATTTPTNTATTASPGNATQGTASNATSTGRDEGSADSGSLGEPGEPPYDNEGFVREDIGQNVRPGRRIKNPLGYLASYTYQLSLYMISPDAYDAFVASGRKNIFLYNDTVANTESTAEDTSRGGAYLIAQSAGMGPNEYRAEGFDLDYYIDNLSFKAMIAASETGAPVANTEYRFKIVEPYGFSFTTKLKKAQETLVKQSGGQGTGKYLENGNPTKMFYILGIRFYGWDQLGNLITGKENFDGAELDPSASGTGALFETFYDIVITEFKFKIDGNATTYDIKAETANISSTVNVTKGMVPDKKELSGNTVRDFISGPNGLLTQLNKDQATLVKNKSAEFPITYKVQWLGNDAETIALSSLVTPNNEKKDNQAGGAAKNTKESNDATAVNSSPNKNTTKHVAKGNSPIIQELEQIVAKSSYINDALTKNYTDEDEVDPKTKKAGSVKGAGAPLTWINVSPNISNIRWDTKRKDWVYDITYVIQTYLVPRVESPYVSKTTKYYGPHKRYDYWYTGQNTEVLSYEQKIDNQFFLAIYDNPEEENNGDTNNTSKSKTQGGKNSPNTTSGGDKSGSKGTKSLEAVNSFRTSLYDPASFASAKVTILGDPDFLLHDSASSKGGSSSGLDAVYSKHYEADGFTVNPTGGQVFIEIDFKEAVDYTRSAPISEMGVSNAPGTLSVNDSIEFWRYPDAETAEQIKGISYQIKSVNCNFQNGSFKQTLDLVINPQVADDALSEEGKREEQALEQPETPTDNQNVGTEPDPAIDPASPNTQTPTPQAAPATT